MDGYQVLLRELKERIRTARLQAALVVNEGLILLYWSIGREILERQTREGWESRVIDRLWAGLRRDFPDMTGLSAGNLKYMRTLAEAHPDREFVQQVVARSRRLSLFGPGQTACPRCCFGCSCAGLVMLCINRYSSGALTPRAIFPLTA
jgi:DUF1016 N-terminal domain